MTEPFVSFVIPVFNSEQTLGLCLESIFNVNYSLNKFEVIVVDNGSTDSSEYIAKQYPVVLYSKPGGTISSVRNFGALHAKGELVAFVDSDCMIKRNWLKEAVSVLRDSSVGAVGSGYLTPEHYTWVEKAWLYELKKKPFETDFLPGGNIIVRFSAFRMIGGFNESLTTGEDSDLCFRLQLGRFKVINSSSLENVHFGNSKSIKQFIKKEFWYGKNMIENIIMNPFDKVFYMSSITFICTFLVILGGAISILRSNHAILLAACAAIIFITFMSSCYRISKSRKYKYILHLNILYFIYYLVRSLAIIKSVYDKMALNYHSVFPHKA